MLLLIPVAGSKIKKQPLFAALGLPAELNNVRYLDAAGVKQYGSLVSIEREDGSGNCFNVKVRSTAGVPHTVFVRAED